MPQPLLARCAGSLAAQGYATVVFDDGSVQRLENADGNNAARTLQSGEPSSWVGRLCGRDRPARRALERFRHARIENLLTEVPESAPDLALIQIQRHKDVTEARALARTLRLRHPEVVVAVAGQFVNQYARILLSACQEFDAACWGPVEATLAGFAACLERGTAWDSVPGLLYRAGAAVRSGSGYPLPLEPWFAPADYHPARYPGLLDEGKIRLFTIPQTMGHTHLGHYRGGYQPRALIVRDLRQMRQDMELLHRLYGVETFHVSGSHTPPDLIQDFAADCRAMPFRVRYSRDTHVPALRSATVTDLTNSGCEAVALNLLTGSQRTLTDFYGENWTISEAESALSHLRDGGLYTMVTFTYPTPADDHHTRAETLRLASRVRPCGVRLTAPALVPGSRWFQEAREFGFGVSARSFAHWVTHPPIPTAHMVETGHSPHPAGGTRSGADGTRRTRLQAELDELSIPRGASAALGLMARVAGWADQESGYIEKLEQAVRRLNLLELRELIEAFNERATASINTVDLYRPEPVRKVVGS